MSYRIINGKVYPVEPIGSSNLVNKSEKVKETSDFSKILKEKINKESSFRISNHAAERLHSRNISFSDEDTKIINDGINKASKKGCKESVILYKDLALVTSVQNRTIITVIDKNNTKDNVFTNIDSVILL